MKTFCNMILMNHFKGNATSDFKMVFTGFILSCYVFNL